MSFVVSYLVLMACVAQAQSVRSLVNNGNDMYDEKKYADAEVNYKKAVEKDVTSVPGHFNLGNSFYRQNKYDESVKQYEEAIQRSQTPSQKAKSYFNLGDTHLQAQKYEEAVKAFTESLKLNPDDQDAKYNLSYAILKMKSSQGKGGKGKPPEPSEWAKRLKRQAETLVARSKFEDAYGLMNDGLRKDPTVAAFNDFIERIGVVVGVKRRN
ncbi:MAG: tetratricopeptide repeat protein [Ignavibacteriae bacterium]|nr:tetratricopeptide repeat protein [Ignavibacteriota bacterium]